MEARKPHFFKVLVDDFEQKLQIPKSFIKNISEKSSEMAILKGPSGSRWCVRLKRTIDGMYLEDGWRKFARAHSLGIGEFLVFRYDGNAEFTVQVFDSSTLEKEDAFKVVNSKEEIICDRGKKRLRPLEEKQKHHTESWGTSKWPCNPTQSSQHHREGRLLEQKKADQSRRSNSHKGTNNYSKEEDRAVRAAKNFKLEHPFFTILMQPSFIFYAPIPPSFSRRYFSKEAGDITIMLSDGRTLNVRYLNYDTKSYKLMRGWKRLVKELDIKKEDLCVFELMSSKNLLFKVHILRDA